MRVKVFLIVFWFFLIAFLFFYVKYHYTKVMVKQAYIYYDMISFLQENNIKSAKNCAKEILKGKQGTVYYDLSLFLIYKDFKEKNEEQKILNLCKLVKKNKRSILNGFIECKKYFYKNNN